MEGRFTLVSLDLPFATGFNARLARRHSSKTILSSCVKVSSRTDEGVESACKTPMMSTSLALVPLDESRILPHEKPTRQFDIAGHKFTIQQDWQNLGVAAVVWDSAIVLAEYLHEHRHLVDGKKVLELGAGTGLTGLVAASIGADVIVTERAEALDHLKSTITSNTDGESWKLTAEVLDWTEKIDSQTFKAVDVILGADIIYIEDTFQDLLRTLLSLSSDRKVLILLSCRIRYDRDLKFLSMLEENFDVSEIYFDDQRKIKIFSVTRHS